MGGVPNVLRHLWAWRTVMILLFAPILLLPLPLIINTKEALCAYVVLLMAVYWITESLPVGVTALLPIVLFPMFEILNSSDVAAAYMNDVNMLFIGGLMVAIAIEYWNLHRRVALMVLRFVGTEPRWLMLGMMSATWFLSMWISNTATTAMMIPIMEAILVQLKGTDKAENKSMKDNKPTEMKEMTQKNGTTVLQTSKNHTGDTNINDVTVSIDASKGDKNGDAAHSDPSETGDEPDDPNFTRMCKGMSLSICYAANAGGIASLTGTGPNLALKAHADSIYQKVGLRNPVTFGTWMGFGLPLALLILIVCWLWLQVAFLRCKGSCKCCSKKKDDGAERSRRIRQLIQDEYNKLGSIVFGQVMIIILFLALVTLWITRDLGGVAGWGLQFNPPVKDGAAGIFVAILLFALPSTLPCLKSYSNPAHPSKWQMEDVKSVDKRLIRAGPLEIQPLLHWKVVHERLPWHLFLLLGGGYAMSKGCETSGLSTWIGHQLEFLSDWNQWGILFIICYVTAMATEVTSNTAIATLLMPIMSELASTIGVHPLYFMFPAALASSFAFMLPVATPPNAIVFAYGRVRIIDMALAGLVMNIMAVPVLIGVTGTIGNAIFNLDSVPAEFLNKTLLGTLAQS